MLVQRAAGSGVNKLSLSLSLSLLSVFTWCCDSLCVVLTVDDLWFFFKNTSF